MAGLTNHQYFKSGNAKTVCVSTVLDAFGIRPHQYRYAWSAKRGNIFDSILRRFGWSVRKLNKFTGKTVGAIRNEFGGAEGEYFIIWVTKKCGYSHLILLDSHGKTITDTNPRKRDRRRVVQVWKVKRKD